MLLWDRKTSIFLKLSPEFKVGPVTPPEGPLSPQTVRGGRTDGRGGPPLPEPCLVAPGTPSQTRGSFSCSGPWKSHPTVPGPTSSGGFGGGPHLPPLAPWAPGDCPASCNCPHSCVCPHVLRVTGPVSSAHPHPRYPHLCWTPSAGVLFPHEATLLGPESGPVLVFGEHHVAYSAASPVPFPPGGAPPWPRGLSGAVHAEGVLGDPSSWGWTWAPGERVGSQEAG